MLLSALPAVRSRWFAGAILTFAVLLAGAPARARAADSPSAERVQFVAAWAAAKLGGSAWQVLAKGLEDYPLYPYIEAAALQHDVASLKTPQVKAWLARYPGTIPAENVRRAYLTELAGREDWEGFRSLYRPGLGDALACDALRGALARGETLHFDRDLASLWRDTSLPPECTPVLDWAHDHGLLTRARIWQRIERAAQHGPARTIDDLADWLPKSQAAAARRLALVRRDPKQALDDARGWHDSPRARAAVTLALLREASRDSAYADAQWQRLRKHFKFSASARHRIEARITLYRATNYTDTALKRLRDLPKAAQTSATRAWRVRVALARGNWKAVRAALDAMPTDQQHDETWRYWRARSLRELGHKKQAHALFAKLADNADYYGFLAADQIDAAYAICPTTIDADIASEQKLLTQPGLERAFEFFALGLLKPARREWDHAQAKLDDHERRLAADAATRRGWWDRAIFAFASGGGKHLYRWRFPLARKAQLMKASRAASIDPAWAYAIIRAESAWQPDAHSGADARGLMQLVPATAQQVARQHQLPYQHASDLYDPAVNIPIGTRYLAALAARYNGAPWLASAAYNAGPSRVSEWLDARASLAPDMFVATIPFKETRAYVRRVMAFAVVYDWRLNGQVLDMSSRMPPSGQSYTLPSAHSARTAVVCAATAPSTGKAKLAAQAAPARASAIQRSAD